MPTYKTLAVVDDIHVCDCCGKSNLKSTVAMESDAGEIVHFGSVCATRHSGRDAKTIRSEAADAAALKQEAAETEYRQCPEKAAYDARLALARGQRIRPGRAFADFVRVAGDAARVAATRIAAKHGVKSILS